MPGFSLLSYAVCTAALSSTNKCPVNQTFSACEGNCSISCPEVVYGVSTTCSNNCVPGCRCKKGFAKIADRCIIEMECKCKEVYSAHFLHISYFIQENWNIVYECLGQHFLYHMQCTSEKNLLLSGKERHSVASVK